MISGTQFRIEDPQILANCKIPKNIATSGEISDFQAECESGRAMCLACDDGIVVFTVRGFDNGVELFVLLAVAFRYGAFKRQVSAVLKIARELNCKTIAFQTRRRGWSRVLGPEWQPRGSKEFWRPVRWVAART